MASADFILVNWRCRISKSLSSSWSVVKDGIGGFLIYTSQKLLILVTTILLARLLGSQGYGIYASALAVVTLIGVPCSLGLPTLAIRLIASYKSTNNWSLARGLIDSSRQLLFAVTVTVGLVASATAWWCGQSDPAWVHTFWWSTALLLLGALTAFQAGVIRGLGHVVLGQLPEALVAPGFFVLALCSWSAVAEVISPQTAMALRVLATALTYVTVVVLLVHVAPSQLSSNVPIRHQGEWMRSASPLIMVATMAVLNTQSNVLLLAAFRGSETAGIYQAAARGAELVTFSAAIMNHIIQPSISRHYSQGDLRSLQNLILKSARVTFLLALPVTVFFVVLANPIMETLYGRGFESGASSFVILVSSQAIALFFGPAREVLTMTGHEKHAAIGAAFATLVNVTISIALIPVFGLAGAAVGAGLSVMAGNVFLAERVRRTLGLKSAVVGQITGKNR